MSVKGFASAAFHSFPDAMRFDPYTGDYGPNFFGHAVNTGTFLTHDDAMGWICFGGNVAERHGVVHATVLDSSRDRLFIASLGLWIALDAGHIVAVDFDPQKHSVKLHLAPASAYVSTAPSAAEANERRNQRATLGRPQSENDGCRSACDPARCW